MPAGRVKEKCNAWNSAMEKLQSTSKKIAQDLTILFIPLQKPFEDVVSKASVEYWIWDGIHPTPAGHELMAQEWMRRVKV